jgi:hypothetical protein
MVGEVVPTGAQEKRRSGGQPIPHRQTGERKETTREQRVYRGEVAPSELADYLVGQYEPKQDLQAQKLGQGDSLMVQIGRGDQPEEIRHAVTVAVTRRSDGVPGVMVTLGQQQWLNPKMATFAAMMGLIGLLVTPWALFALIWPVSDLVGSATLPGDVWNTIDTYLASLGAMVDTTQQVAHPHER